VRLAGPSFGAALAGQVMIAIAQPLVLNAVTGVSGAYLCEASRPLGIALGSAGIFLGMLVSLALGSALGGGRIHALLVVGAACGVVAALALIAALVPGDHPPVTGDVTGVHGLRTVWRDPLVRRLATFAFLGFGIFVAVTTWLQPLLKPAGISASTAGWLLVVMVIAGVIGSAVAPPAVIRAGADRRLFLTAAAVTCAACVLLAVVKAVPVIGVGVAATGLVMLTSLPVILELAERRAGPAGTSATALIWLAGNAGGIVVALVIQTVEHHPLPAFLVLAVVAGLAALAVPRRKPAPVRG
jgi:predicted MFS family arabinose efflux permease